MTLYIYIKIIKTIYYFQVANSSTKDLDLSSLSSLPGSQFSYYYLVGAVTTKIEPATQDIDGTNTVNHLTIFSLSKTLPYEQKNKAIPEDILSKKL